MIVSLFLGVLKNNWQLAALLVSIVAGAAFWKGEHVLLLHTRSELAAKMALLDEAKALAKTQDTAAAAVNAQQKVNRDVIQSQLTSALQAHALTGAALTASVLKYENVRGRGQVCAGSGAAGGNPGHGSDATGRGANQRVDLAIASIPASCQAVIDELGACQTWAKGVRCQVPP